jgi:DNA mismatch endonuclease, patch repair protein
MRAIKSRGNRSTEQRLRAMLVRAEFRGWTMRAVTEIGSPDFVFSSKRTAVFVDGCFWHGCPRCGHLPKRNRAYWKAKIERNQRRDRAVIRLARSLGFVVVRIWECELKDRPHLCLARISRALSVTIRDQTHERPKR